MFVYRSKLILYLILSYLHRQSYAFPCFRPIITLDPRARVDCGASYGCYYQYVLAVDESGTTV
jgi:hypothetical protein